MQTKFALPSNPSHVFVEKQPSSSQQSPSSELSSDSPPLLEWLSRLCPSTLFMYMSFPKLGLLKGKPLYLLTTRFASKTNAAVNGSKAQPQLFHWNPQLELLSTKNQPCGLRLLKGAQLWTYVDYVECNYIIAESQLLSNSVDHGKEERWVRSRTRRVQEAG